MALEKLTITDKIETLHLATGYPVIQVRQATIIVEDGEEISRKFHRHVLNPDVDVSGESNEVKAIAAVVFTAQARAKYAEYIASLTPTIQATEVI